MDVITESGLEDVSVKLHPRQTDSSVYIKHSCAFLQPKSVPFEFFVLWHDFSDNILISIFSSAVVNTVYMFDQRPTIIFLYRVIKDPEYNIHIGDFDLQVKNLRKIYGDQKKIFVPESVENFYSILKIIVDGES